MKKNLFYKVVFLMLIGLIISCESEVMSFQNEGKSNSLNEFYAKHGVKAHISTFKADAEKKIFLPDGMNITVPKNAFKLNNETYTGEVKVYSRVFTKLSDMITSNYQTVDVNGAILTTGGSYELKFFDSEFNELDIDKGKTIKIDFPSKIQNDDMANMNFYTSLFENNYLKWKLTDTKVSFDGGKYYSIDMNSSSNNLNKRCGDCPNCFDPNDRNYYSTFCVELRAGASNNVDRAPTYDGDIINLSVELVNVLRNSNNVGVYIIAPEYNSIAKLIYNENTNSFSSENGTYPDLGNIVITAISVEHGIFKYDILSTNTSSQNYTLNLNPGNEDEYNSIIGSLIN